MTKTYNRMVQIWIHLGLKMVYPQMPWMNISCIFPTKIAILRFLFFSVFMFQTQISIPDIPQRKWSSLNWSVGKAAFCLDQKPPASRLPEKRWVQPEFPALFLTQNSWIQHIQPGLHSGSTTQGISIAGIAPSPIPLGCWYDMFWCFIQHVLRENPSKKTGLLQPSRVIRDRSMTARRFFFWSFCLEIDP